MAELLIRRLERFTRLSEDDRRVLRDMARERIVRVRAQEDLIREGERPSTVRLFLDGWACRYKVLEDGRRSVLAYFLPGDLCDPYIFVLGRMDHSVAAVTDGAVAEIPSEMLQDITAAYPRITQGLWWSSMVESAIQREWTVSLGQRTALERMGHLFCELYCRMEVVGLMADGQCNLPLTQAELADTLGLSVVHVNRTLQDLRGAGLVAVRGGQLTILDFDRLKERSMYSGDYLHLHREGRHLDANAGEAAPASSVRRAGARSGVFYNQADLALARRHVIDADARILRQRALIGRLQSKGHRTDLASELLENFENTVAQMRAHLASIEAELSAKPKAP